MGLSLTRPGMPQLSPACQGAEFDDGGVCDARTMVTEPQCSLTAREIEQLVELRLQLEDAHRAIRSSGIYRRVPAIVALDAAVERATALVAVTRGLPLPREGKMDDLVSRVRQALGDSWKPRMLQDIRHLRRARNAAQHEGLPPDRTLMQGWAAAAQTYVTSLVDAQFGVDLSRLTKADAIRDPEWSGLFRQAELHAQAGQLTEAAMLARDIFHAATRRWDDLQGRHRRNLTPFERDRFAREVVDAVRSQLPSYDDWAFATDPAEALWTREALEQDLTLLDADEVERAFAFVFGWVTSFETTTQDWPSDRGRRNDVRKRRVGDGSLPVQIEGMEGLDSTGSRDSATLRVRLEHLPPPEHYDAWRMAVLMQIPEPRAWQINRDGTATLNVPLTRPEEVRERFTSLQSAMEGIWRDGKFTNSPVDAAMAPTVAPLAELGHDVDVLQHGVDDRRAQLPPWVRFARYQLRHGEIVVQIAHAAVPAVELADSQGEGPRPLRDLIRAQAGVNQCYSVADPHTLELRPAPDVTTLVAALRDVDRLVGPVYQAHQDALQTRNRQQQALLAMAEAALRELRQQPAPRRSWQPGRDASEGP